MTENDLTARQRRFIDALLTSRSTREAAHKVGIGEKTAYRWLRLPQVRKAVSELESDLLSEVVRRLLSMQAEAVDELQELLRDPKLPAGSRLRVIESVIGNLLKMRSAAEFEQRLQNLESMVQKLSESVLRDHQTD